MGVLLLILKIIGITLGVILGIVLLLLLIVLLTPFRYQFFASVHGKEINADVRVHFWLRAVQAKITFEKMRLLGVLRILFIKKTLVDKSFGKAAKGDKEEKPKDEVEEITDEIFSDTVELEETESKEDQIETLLENDKENLAEATSSQEDKPEEVTQAEEVAADTGTGQSVIESCEVAKTEDKDLEDKIDAIIDQIVAKYDLTMEKVEGIKKKINFYLDFLMKDTTQNAIKYLLKIVKKILIHIAPKKAKGYLELGLDSPATMGTIVNYMAMAYPFIPKTFRFTPVFDTDELVLECEIDFKGRLILGSIVIYALPALFNRNVRALLKDLKGLKNH